MASAFLYEVTLLPSPKGSGMATAPQGALQADNGEGLPTSALILAQSSISGTSPLAHGDVVVGSNC